MNVLHDLFDLFSRFLQSAGGRKWLFALAVLAIATFALFDAKLDGSQWVDLQKWLGGTFLLSAAAEGVAGRIRNGTGKPGGSP